MLLSAGCTGEPSPEARSTPSPTPPSTAVEPSGPLATTEPDSAGIVVLRSRVDLDDGPGDVWQLVPRVVRAQLPEIDVRRTVVEVGRRTVRVGQPVRRPPAGRPITYDVGLRTPRGLHYVDVVAGPRTRTGRAEQLVDPSGAAVDCPGLRHEVDDTGDVLSVDVPLRCLGDPPWVAARLLVSLEVGHASTRRTLHNHRPFSEFFTERLYPPGSAG